MIIIPIEKLEKTFGLKFYRKKGKCVLGLDTASTTGYCIARISDGKNMKFETGYIKIKSKNDEEKYKSYIEIFDKLIKHHYQVVVEDTYMGINAKGFKQITRIGGIAFTIAILKGCKARFMMAVHARKNLGFKGNAKKAVITDMIQKLLDLKITHDEADAVILALNGMIKK